MHELHQLVKIPYYKSVPAPPPTLSDREVVELFHLTFLRLLASGPDKDRYIVKGGCNLRFFYGSPRYSDDLDLDVTKAPREALKAKVDKLLASPPLTAALRSSEITLGAVTAPKQTETTQRWKIALVVAGRSRDLHTKIEFSRRGRGGQAQLEPIAQALAHHYRLTPPLVMHYLLPAAIQQKVRALTQRSVVQARDVFDLDLLLARAGGTFSPHLAPGPDLKLAVDRAMELSYGEFAAQVVAFLPPDEAPLHDSQEAWEAMQLRVAEALSKVAG